MNRMYTVHNVYCDCMSTIKCWQLFPLPLYNPIHAVPRILYIFSIPPQVARLSYFPVRYLVGVVVTIQRPLARVEYRAPSCVQRSAHGGIPWNKRMQCCGYLPVYDVLDGIPGVLDVCVVAPQVAVLGNVPVRYFVLVVEVRGPTTAVEDGTPRRVERFCHCWVTWHRRYSLHQHTLLHNISCSFLI